MTVLTMMSGISISGRRPGRDPRFFLCFKEGVEVENRRSIKFGLSERKK